MATALMAVSVFSNAQEKSSRFLEFQTDIPTVGGNPVLDVQYGVLKQVDSNVKLGWGIGLSESTGFEHIPNIPLFGRAEFLLTNSGNVRPFFDFDLGMSINVEHIDNSAFFLNPVFGAYFNKFSIGAGYMGGKSFVEGAKWSSSISIRLGYTFSGAGKGKKMIWKNTAMYRFMKHTTFGLEASIGTGLGKKKCDDKYHDGSYEFSGLSCKSIGFHWLYDIDKHWAAGIGIQYGGFDYHKVSGSWNNEEDVSDDNMDAFLRCEYTHDEITKNLKPYGTIDFGINSYGGGIYLAPQIGIKFKDQYRLGVSVGNRGGLYDAEWDATTLQLHLGVDF